MIQEAERAQAESRVLRIGAEGLCRVAEEARGAEAALEHLRRALALLDRAPADERDALHHRTRELVVEVALLRAPAWFVALPDDRRPHPVLPPGVSWGERPGEYLRASDGAVLGWVDDGWREVR
jgi:hypothetical protein